MPSTFRCRPPKRLSSADIREPIFAPDSWGGYLIYRLYPQNKVFVDDRHDLYGEEFLKDYLKAVRLTPEWEKFLNEKKVNWVLVPSESPLANMLEETSRWNMVYRDGTSVLFERTTGRIGKIRFGERERCFGNQNRSLGLHAVIGVLRLRECFAKRSSHSAQDDKTRNQKTRNQKPELYSIARDLELVVGVDIESEDGVDLDGLISAQRGTELPAIKRGQDFAGHDGGGGFEHLRLAQQSRCGRRRRR